MSNETTLPLLLKELKLANMYTSWQDEATRATKDGWSYSKYLAMLCELEVNERFKKRIQRNTSIARLPSGKTLATFDFASNHSIKKEQIIALSEDPSWVHEGDNLIIFGPSGVGKTHIASGIAYCLITKGIRCLFTTTTKLVQQLQTARKEYKLPEAIARLDRFQLLLLDDIGYAEKDEMETSVLFELIASRYERGSIVITANQPFSQWDKIFPDNMMAVAAIDRLVHHATIINIEGESFRTAKEEDKTAKKKPVQEADKTGKDK